jgi:WD40 repeat protein
MLPDRRLAVLLDQVKRNQVNQCIYHNPTTPHSLFSDHVCDRSQFPLQAVLTLPQTDEVWFLEFSHDGRRLATCGKDPNITVYDTMDFEVRYNLADHTQSVNYLSWSPDDTKMISCSSDHTAKVWDMSVGSKSNIIYLVFPLIGTYSLVSVY